ncbi:MFS transporter [Curtobacterium sp. PhB130]|uniref:MFS transporter n=1 Tax=Curtobacterium sp. PhB130 TaxID=2485178 RepID=UPI0016094150|nr:MFS transporter [Curtobacterium sp. PhB130]
MKRSFLFVPAATALIAVTYGLVRLAYGLVLPDVQADLHLGSTGAGWISAGASVMYCVGAVAGFLLASRYPRSLVVLAAATAGIGSAGVAASGNSAVFGAAAVLASAGAGLASPALVRLVVRNTRADAVARTQSIVNAGTGPGLVVAGVLALVLLPEWRTAWVISAVCAFLAGAAVLWSDRAAPGAPSERPSLPSGDWWSRHRGLLLGALLLGAGSAAVWNSGRAVLIASGADRTTSVLAWIALGLGGAAVIVTERWIGRRSPSRAWAVTALGVVVGTLALGVAPTVVPVAIVACVLFGWGYTAATGALIAWTSELDQEHAPSGTSMLFVTLVLGQALGAAAAGVVVDTAGYGVMFVLAAAVTALGVVVPTLATRRAHPTRRAVRQDGLP